MESKACSSLPAPLAELAVPLSVARRGQRCQRDVRALCATRDQHQPSHVHSTHHARASHTLTPSSVHVSITYEPFVFIFSPFIPSCRCACWLIGDALCAICSNPTPPFHTHKHTLVPLITRVGLTICVPVCSHSDKREDVCVCRGCGGGVGGCSAGGVAITDIKTGTPHCVLRLETNN